jgi:hypothetical protein
LPAPVKRALAWLPRAVLDGLAGLDPAAQRALLAWPLAAQMAMIAGLAALFAGDADEPAEPAAPRAPTGLLAVGGPGPAEPRLPPDLIDFLLGRGAQPGWFGSVTVPRPVGRRPLPQLTGGPPEVGPVIGPAPPPDRITRPPSSEHQLLQQNRERFGEELATGYERPLPSATPVTATPEVGAFVGRHLERVAEDRWRTASAQASGTQAQQAAAKVHDALVAAAQAQALADKQAYDELPSHVRQRRTTVKPKPAPRIPAPDLADVDRQARAEWLADLDALRGQRLTRVNIDGVVAELGTPAVHGALATNGAAMLARVARHLTPPELSELLAAAPNGKLPAALTDPVAAALPGVLAANGTPAEILGGLSALGPQMAVLVQLSAADCVILLRLPKLGLLKTMLAGGQAAHLAALISRDAVSIAMVNTLMVAVDTPATFGLVCGPGAAAVEVLLGAGLSAATLQIWCRPPAVTATVQLLGHAGLAACAPILSLLAAAQPAVLPAQLMAPLTAGAAPATVAGAVWDAPALVQTVAQALVYFTTHPAGTFGRIPHERGHRGVPGRQSGADEPRRRLRGVRRPVHELAAQCGAHRENPADADRGGVRAVPVREHVQDSDRGLLRRGHRGVPGGYLGSAGRPATAGCLGVPLGDAHPPPAGRKQAGRPDRRPPQAFRATQAEDRDAHRRQLRAGRGGPPHEHDVTNRHAQSDR